MIQEMVHVLLPLSVLHEHEVHTIILQISVKYALG